VASRETHSDGCVSLVSLRRASCLRGRDFSANKVAATAFPRFRSTAMKPLSALFFALALTAPLAIRAADFEGTVTMKLTGPRGTPSEMTFSLAKNRSRIDMQTGSSGNPAILFDQAKQEMTIVMPEQKMYMVRPLPKPDELPAGARADGATIEKTGETEKILGYDCVKYISSSPDGVTEIWVTDQLGTFMGLGGGNPMGGRSMIPDAWASSLRGKDAFPLRVVTKSAKGKDSFRMEATSVNKTTLPASTFTPPVDYQKFDMDGMMRGMGMPGMRLPGSG
jgi:hypothetical protein